MAVYKRNQPKPPRGTPPVWFGWLAPTTGLAALIVSFTSLGISRHNYDLAEKSFRTNTAQRVSITHITLTHSKVKQIGDLPVVSFQIQNSGLLTISDLHSQFFFSYKKAPIVSGPDMWAGISRGGGEQGPTVIQGDHEDRTQLIIGGMPGVAQASYSDLTNARAVIALMITTQATDTSGARILTCDLFDYTYLTDTFERRGACPAPDWVMMERKPPQSSGTVIPVPLDTRAR